MESGLRSSMVASTALIILTALAGTTFADSQANAIRDVQRPTPRQSAWKSFGRRMKSYFEEQKKTLEIIQGKRPAEY